MSQVEAGRKIAVRLPGRSAMSAITEKAKSALLAAGLRVSQTSSSASFKEALGYLRLSYDQNNLVRIGHGGDGGYLIPDDLDGIKACFSPGVDVVASFEGDLADRGIPSHLCDASVDGPPKGFAAASFEKKFLAAFDSGIFTTLSSWFSRHASLDDDHDYILQMDIEGAEYEVILNASQQLLRKFRIIVVEYHYLSDLLGSSSQRHIAKSLEKMALDFRPIHIHPNNGTSTFYKDGISLPRVIEVTYLRRDRASAVTTRAMSFPHPLDFPCMQSRPELELDPYFYSDSNAL